MDFGFFVLLKLGLYLRGALGKRGKIPRPELNTVKMESGHGIQDLSTLGKINRFGRKIERMVGIEI